MTDLISPQPLPVQMAVTEATDVRARIDAMSQQQIEARRLEILQEAAGGNYESLSTESLHELAYIAQRLRRTNVGPPKEPKKPATKLKSMDDFL